MEDTLLSLQDTLATMHDTLVAAQDSIPASDVVTGVTGDTWLVTGLGFGIVIILLCAFVFIMQGLGAIMQRIDGKSAAPKAAPAPKKTYAQDADGATTAAIAKALELAGEDTDMAAVAMALNLYYGVHDIEAPKLTILGHSTQWNSNKF